MRLARGFASGMKSVASQHEIESALELAVDGGNVLTKKLPEFRNLRLIKVVK